jgi:hypothetical protein
VSYPRITASEICALLTVACFTDATGIYSTAGAKAIRKSLAIGTPAAEALLNSLSNKGFIHDPKWIAGKELKKGMPIMPIREGRAMVRWVIKPDNSRPIWFSSSLVRGYGRWMKPLQALRGCGELSARLLLALYTFEDAMTYGGISPMSVLHCYTTEKMLSSHDGEYSLHHAEQGQKSVYARLYEDMLGIRSKQNGDSLEPFWKALNQLEKRGFIYECLTVFTGTEVDEDMCLLYPLHTYNRYGHAPKGEESLASTMHKIASLYDCPTADESGRFYGRFAFIADESQPVQAVGIYRLRFRNTSPAFEEVLDGWLNINKCKAFWKDEVERLLAG